jgi:hypothetical protein
MQGVLGIIFLLEHEDAAFKDARSAARQAQRKTHIPITFFLGELHANVNTEQERRRQIAAAHLSHEEQETLRPSASSLSLTAWENRLYMSM